MTEPTRAPLTCPSCGSTALTALVQSFVLIAQQDDGTFTASGTTDDAYDFAVRMQCTACGVCLDAIETGMAGVGTTPPRVYGETLDAAGDDVADQALNEQLAQVAFALLTTAPVITLTGSQP